MNSILQDSGVEQDIQADNVPGNAIQDNLDKQDQSGKLGTNVSDVDYRSNCWLRCICVVDFDTDAGHALQHEFPIGTLSDFEMNTLLKLSLPDYSQSIITDDTTFSFRIRHDSNLPLTYSDVSDQTFSYGFSFFRTTEDTNQKRKFSQSSSLYFDTGVSIIEDAYCNITEWPNPSPGLPLNLCVTGFNFSGITPGYDRTSLYAYSSKRPEATTCANTASLSESCILSAPGKSRLFGNSALDVSNPQIRRPSLVPVPDDSDADEPHRRNSSVPPISSNKVTDAFQLCRMPFLNPTSHPFDRSVDVCSQKFPKTVTPDREAIVTAVKEMQENAQGFFQEINAYESFQQLLSGMWFLWELVLIGEPILLLCPTPSRCSECVFSLLAIISPLVYAGDYRPYMNAYDPDFIAYQRLSDKQRLPSVILGTTNPLFLEAMNQFSTIVVINSPLPMFPKTRKYIVCKSLCSNAFILSNYVACCSPDSQLLKQFLKADSGNYQPAVMSVINNSLIRKHFLELTQSFLTPFDPYFEYDTSILSKNPFAESPALPVFSPSTFLANLKPTRLLRQLTSNRYPELYKRFLFSPTFRLWYSERAREGGAKVEELHSKFIIDADYRHLLPRLSVHQIAEGCATIRHYLQQDLRDTHQTSRDKLEKILGKLKSTVAKRMIQASQRNRISGRQSSHPGPEDPNCNCS